MDGHCLLNVPQQLSATLPRSGPVMYVQVGMSCEEPWTTMDMESLPPPMCLYLVPSSSHAKKGKTRKKKCIRNFRPCQLRTPPSTRLLVYHSSNSSDANLLCATDFPLSLVLSCPVPTSNLRTHTSTWGSSHQTHLSPPRCFVFFFFFFFFSSYPSPFLPILSSFSFSHLPSAQARL